MVQLEWGPFLHSMGLKNDHRNDRATVYVLKISVPKAKCKGCELFGLQIFFSLYKIK